MKKTLLPLMLLLLVAALSACGPAAKGKQVAKKFCECSEMEDIKQRKECNDQANEEYQKYHRQYLTDKEDLQAFNDAFENHRTCME